MGDVTAAAGGGIIVMLEASWAAEAAFDLSESFSVKWSHTHSVNALREVVRDGGYFRSFGGVIVTTIMKAAREEAEPYTSFLIGVFGVQVISSETETSTFDPVLIQNGPEFSASSLLQQRESMSDNVGNPSVCKFGSHHFHVLRIYLESVKFFDSAFNSSEEGVPNSQKWVHHYGCPIFSV
jgi:hypothetical protein